MWNQKQNKNVTYEIILKVNDYCMYKDRKRPNFVIDVMDTILKGGISDWKKDMQGMINLT